MSAHPNTPGNERPLVKGTRIDPCPEATEFFEMNIYSRIVGEGWSIDSAAVIASIAGLVSRIEDAERRHAEAERLITQWKDCAERHYRDSKGLMATRDELLGKVT